MRAMVLSLCLSLVLLAGCGTHYNYRAEGWVGHHREELVRSWGPPTLEVPLGDPGMLVGSSTIVYTQEPGHYTLNCEAPVAWSFRQLKPGSFRP